jgi:subtilisin-like proprotein convertase family protein
VKNDTIFREKIDNYPNPSAFFTNKMKTKPFICAALTLGISTSAFAQSISEPTTNNVAKSANSLSQTLLLTTTTNYLVNLPVPDNSPSGLVSSKDFSSPITRLGSVNVTLNISGNFNGDLFGYLSHDSGFSVLLNREGRSATSNLGYGDGGFNVTLSDGAANGDIHTYRLRLSGNNNTPINGPLTGTWQPDGRNIDPGSVLDTSARTAFLNSFYTLNPNGKWTLFLADLAPGGTSTLVSWGLEVTTIPEPSNIALMILGGFGLLFGSRRFRKV